MTPANDLVTVTIELVVGLTTVIRGVRLTDAVTFVPLWQLSVIVFKLSSGSRNLFRYRRCVIPFAIEWLIPPAS